MNCLLNILYIKRQVKTNKALCILLLHDKTPLVFGLELWLQNFLSFINEYKGTVPRKKLTRLSKTLLNKRIISYGEFRTSSLYRQLNNSLKTDMYK